VAELHLSQSIVFGVNSAPSLSALYASGGRSLTAGVSGSTFTPCCRTFQTSSVIGSRFRSAIFSNQSAVDSPVACLLPKRNFSGNASSGAANSLAIERSNLSNSQTMKAQMTQLQQFEEVSLICGKAGKEFPHPGQLSSLESQAL
jgi:hypothetical protein